MKPLSRILIACVIAMLACGLLNIIVKVDLHPVYRDVVEKVLLFLTGTLFVTAGIWAYIELIGRFKK